MMNWMMKLNITLPILLRLGLGIIFLWSGWEKLLNPALFYQAAQAYHVLSPQLTAFYSAALPWFEVLCGAFLLAGLFMRFTTLLTGALLLSFVIAVSIALLKGKALDCGCFLGGVHPSPITPALLYRDLLFLAGTVYLFFSQNIRFSLDGYFKNSEA